MRLIANDCSPFSPQPKPKEVNWLRDLAKSVKANDFVVPVGGKRDDDEPIVYCDWDGTWWAGRYVGSLSFEGHVLIIEPRFGLSTLRKWLSEATSVVLVDSPGRLHSDASFVVQLLAAVWAHGFVEAARHGLPALRKEVITKGPVIRGRLDVAASISQIVAGTHAVVSIRTERSLDHAASNAIVAAFEVLRRWLGVPDDSWLPQRAKELIPKLQEVTGFRPTVPSEIELKRIRYTPITAAFARIAELSRQIANRRGLTTDIDATGDTKGILLDVAELWEMYVLSAVRKAERPLTVKHITKETKESRMLLHSSVNGMGIGRMLPDAVLFENEEVRGVIDAKYKPLHPSKVAPQGPQRDDLYQLAAYLGRYAPASKKLTWGLLAYPLDPAKTDIAPAEVNSPWELDDDKKIVFTTLPHNIEEAVRKLRTLFAQLSPDNQPFGLQNSRSKYRV